MKKKKSQIAIVLVTAGLTFGSLMAAKGGFYKHHQHHQNKHHCDQVDAESPHVSTDIQSEKVE